MFLRLFGIVLAGLLLVTQTGPAQAANDVVQLYNSLQRTAKFKLDYKIRQNQTGWSTVNTGLGTTIPVRVDLRNGYMFFSDEGTGGGNFDLQVRLFHKSGKKPLIVLVESGYNPPFPDGIKIRTFARSNNVWAEETNWSWTELTLDDFMTGEMTIDDLRALKTIRAQIYISLPPKGRVIVAYLVVNENMTEKVCSGDSSIVVPDKKPYQRYCRSLKSRLFTAINMNWDSEENRFKKGRKSKVQLNWRQ